MARILGINGIYNLSGSKYSFTDRFLHIFAYHHEVVDIKYPWMFAILAYFPWAMKRRAMKIVEANKPGDIAIAHSAGCLLTIYAMRMGAKFSKVFFFGAAVNRDMEIPEDAYNVIYNIHSEADNALLLGKKFPWHDFGGMGKKGYNGNSKNIINVDAGEMGHNDYVTPTHIYKWVNFIRANN